MVIKTRSSLESSYGLFVANLVRLYRRADPDSIRTGSAWYPTARRIVREWAETYQTSEETVASVIAALSPQCSWDRNIIAADDVLAQRALSVGGPLRTNERKARRIAYGLDTIASAFPSGPKVNCFAANLAGDNWIVTVDTHAAQAARNNPRWVPSLHMAPYQVLARAYQRAAVICQCEPATFQAIVWHEWKRRYAPEVKRELQRVHGRITRLRTVLP